MTATTLPQPRAFIGVDLGQRRNHSAFAVIELRWDAAEPSLLVPRLVLRYLRRVPLFTDYIDVHNDIVTLATDSPLPADVIVDAAGPGGPMVDWLRRSLPRGVELKPVLITSGHAEGRHSDGYRTIPRRTLITELILMINYRTLTIPPGLVHWDTLVAEMLQIRGENGHPVADGHDDLVMALGLGANAVTKLVPELRPAFRGRKNN